MNVWLHSSCSNIIFCILVHSIFLHILYSTLDIVLSFPLLSLSLFFSRHTAGSLWLVLCVNIFLLVCQGSLQKKKGNQKTLEVPLRLRKQKKWPTPNFTINILQLLVFYQPGLGICFCSCICFVGSFPFCVCMSVGVTVADSVFLICEKLNSLM